MAAIGSGDRVVVGCSYDFDVYGWRLRDAAARPPAPVLLATLPEGVAGIAVRGEDGVVVVGHDGSVLVIERDGQEAYVYPRRLVSTSSPLGPPRHRSTAEDDGRPLGSASWLMTTSRASRPRCGGCGSGH